MSLNRVVEATTAPKQQRAKSLQIFRFPQFWLVGESMVPNLGLNPETALAHRIEFANILLEICNRIAAQPTASLPDELPTEPDAILEALRPVIELDDCDDFLDRLRMLGAPLWKDLSTEMKKALTKYQIWSTAVDQGNDPPLNFVLPEDQAESKAPILWNMLYQGGDQSEWPPKWQNFWGFRLPITQWLVNMPRREEIKLDAALSVIDENLYFPSHEVTFLVQQLGEARHQNFAQLLQSLAEHELQKKLSETDWWQRCDQPEKVWLRQFLDWWAGSEEQRSRRADIWMRQALKTVFVKQTPYSLIHFACHCIPQQTELLSSLKIQVAGEAVALNAAFLNTDLGRKQENEEWQLEDPGPLVFLNACASGQQPKGNAFPGFPVQWIRRQGAKAVIVTLCHVPDIFAYAFAVKFYDILFKALQASKEQANTPVPDLYVAEALLKTRKFFMAEFNNPLGLAYDLYAVRDAYVQPKLGG